MTSPAYDFDTRLDRSGTWSLKWEKYAGRDVIPMWVADMDFRSPPEVIAMLRSRVEHGVFGYIEPGPELAEAIIARLQESYGWSPSPEHFVWLPGLVSGLNIVCRAIGEPGDDVLTGVPIYPPFLSAPMNAQRRCVRVPLLEDGGRWTFPARALDEAVGERSRLFLLCNPHNPVGRVYDKRELEALAEASLRRNLVICSDEIHCGLVLDEDKRHVPFASLSPEIAARTITLMAASKTFNLPGLGSAFAIIPDRTLRARVNAVMKGIVHRPMTLGLWATLAAYRDGEPWRRALVARLRDNRDLVAGRVATWPGFRMAPVEGTYLAWLDLRDTGRDRWIEAFEAGGVGLYDGADFGTPGFLRLNFACPTALLAEALDRMGRVIRG